MKKIFISCLVLMLVVSGIAIGRSSKEQSSITLNALKKANELVGIKHYKSGYDLLELVDPANENPDVVLKKVDLLLNYYTVNTMYQTFGLRDLKKDETIDAIRGEQGDYSYYYLEINNVLEKLIKAHPTDWRLYQTLGEYYFEVYVNYENNWFKPGKELLDLAENNYIQADQNGVFDTKSIFTLGYIYLQEGNYEKSVANFLRYLKFDINNANANYNLAYAYLKQGKTDDSLKYAETALNLYGGKEDKAGAARFIAGIYQDKNDTTNAVKFYELSETLCPNNYYNLKALLELYIKSGDLNSAAVTAEALFALNPTDVDTIQEIFRNYYNNGQKEELVAFFTRMEQKYAARDDVMGNISFHEGYYYKFEKDYTREKDYFTKARAYFTKCYKDDYYLFKTIAEELRVIPNN